ncbi:NEAT domain-containing protein [Levilactobacillus tongjiangensis]|uniref:NEAT domain-containing protein n=1 Tax=Levilactobacillus tongjiangensis TaxID=2486023 RepID=A0ABW1SSL3_9LACO|nr:NEAT domain-containing protein [Levilactobacillus tongjiangensis]
MQRFRRFLQVVGLLMLGIVAVSFSQSQGAHAATTLDDGIYQVPMKIIKSDSSDTSSANAFFGGMAVVRVQHGQYTVMITSNGEQYIKSMKVAGTTLTLAKTLDSQAIYQFSLAKPVSPLTTSFNLTTPMGAMKESARMTLDWKQAKSVSTDATAANLLSQAEKLVKATASSRSHSAVCQPKAPTTKSTTATSGVSQPATKSAEYWKYQVIQGDKMKKSDADQYYTDVAKVVPTKNGYQVTLNVKYAKSLKLGSRAVVPEAINGQSPQNISYGQSGSNYTMSYTFTISSLRDLTKRLIPGKIHVTVPALNISQTFPVRFRFAASGAADLASAANVSALPKKTVAKSAAAPAVNHTTSAAKLPETGHQNNLLATLVGSVLLGTLIIWGGKRHA